VLQYVTPLIPERPAVPKSVTICDDMPLTPIGKIFKPSLRALAIASVIQDRIDRAFSEGPKPTFTVKQAGARFVVQFRALPEDATQHNIQNLMAKFAIDFEVIN
jgi:fatty-acyl-CoA synthase